MGIFSLSNRLSVQTLTQEEDLLWSYLDSLVNITHIMPIAYQGASAGSEFLTYAATKMYLALDIDISYTTGAANVTAAQVNFYNISNALELYGINTAPVWDVTAAGFKYVSNNYNKKNLLFSRLALTLYSYLHFVGYRITIS